MFSSLFSSFFIRLHKCSQSLFLTIICFTPFFLHVLCLLLSFEHPYGIIFLETVSFKLFVWEVYTIKLNLDCLRDTLIAIEENHHIFVDDDGCIEKSTLWINDLCSKLPTYSKEDVFYAVFNLEQAGYINASIRWIGSCVQDCAINYMTYSGHEFLNKICDGKRWHHVKVGLSAVRDFSLSAINSIAEGMTSAAINTYISKG